MLPAVKRGKISSKIFQLRRHIFPQNHSFSRRIKADFPQSQAISSLFKSFKPWRSGFLILHEYSQLDNITADDCSVYSSEQGIRFVRANILGSKDGITTHSCQYITIRGADVYYLTGIALYGDTLTSSEYDFVEKVAGGLRFTGPAPLPRTASAGLNGDDPLYKVLVGVLSAACLGLIAWVIRNMRKKSAPCVPAQAMPPAAEPFGATTVGAPPVPTASAGPPGTERSGAAPDAVPVFCPLCGQRLPSGVAFCPGCGTPIS